MAHASSADSLASSAPTVEDRPRSSATGILLASAAALCTALVVYWPTLRASYAYDDMDYLLEAADVLAGRGDWLDVAMRPHLEHLAPLLRAAFDANARLFGVWALPFRCLVLGAHAASATLLALVGRRYARSDATCIAIAVAYVLPAGFSSVPVWLLAGSTVPLGLLGANAALCAVAWQEKLGRPRALALAWLGWAILLASDSALAPLALGPILLDELERRRLGDRRLVSGFALGTVFAFGVWIWLSAALYRELHGESLALEPSGAFGRDAFLLAVAPYRLFFPGSRLALPGASEARLFATGLVFGLSVASAITGALAMLLRGERSALLRTAAIAATGPLGYVALVGLGRGVYTYGGLYDADRYFFPLGIPVALLVGAASEALLARLRTVPKRVRVAVLGACVVFALAELGAHVLALRQRIPLWIFAAHERRFTQLAKLAAMLDEAGGRAIALDGAPLEVPDSAIGFPDVHNQRITMRMVKYMIGEADSAFRVGPRVVRERDQALLNPVLESWARAIGEPTPYLYVENGELVNAREAGFADFRVRSHAEKIVSGFEDYGRVSRWMAKHGELSLELASDHLHLLLHVPIDDLRRAEPDAPPFKLRASLVDEASGESVDLGEVEVTRGAIQAYRLDVPPEFFAAHGNGSVRLLLDSSRDFDTAVVLPGTPPGPLRSAEVFYAGFGS